MLIRLNLQRENPEVSDNIIKTRHIKFFTCECARALVILLSPAISDICIIIIAR